MTSEPDGHVQVDAVYSAEDLYITLECKWCPYIEDIDVPVDLDELNRRARQHERMCAGEAPQ